MLFKILILKIYRVSFPFENDCALIIAQERIIKDN